MASTLSKEQKRARIVLLRKIIFLLFALCAILLVADLIAGIVLIAKKVGGKSAKVTPLSSISTQATDDSVTPDSSTDDTSAPAASVKDYLPVNDLSEAYWGPLPVVEDPKVAPHKEVHGIYIGAAAKMDTNIEIAKNSEINAFVIDLKENDGVYFNSTNQFALDMGQVKGYYNLENVVQKCHDNGIYVIGRIVCFNDPNMAAAHPEMSIKDASGNSMTFKLEHNNRFVNPYDTRVWDYLIDLAVEAIGMGVDEIQFDYVRFPGISTKNGENPYFGPEDTTPTRIDAINRFLQTATRKIQDTYGVPLTADVFGIILSSELDGKLIGQGWDTVGLTGIDSLCPMLYPSHYARPTSLNGKSFDKPDLYPYDVMYNALCCGSAAASQEGYAVVRPYVQAFTASYIGSGNYMTYGYNEINAQIKAIQDAGYTEWILWNPSANYPEGNYGGNAG